MYALLNHETLNEAPTPNPFFEFDSPWILLKHTHKRVNYRFTTLDPSHDGDDSIALTFQSEFELEPGKLMHIGVPLPESMRDYEAEVIACMQVKTRFEVSLLIRIHSNQDMLTLMRSNAYLSARYNA